MTTFLQTRFTALSTACRLRQPFSRGWIRGFVLGVLLLADLGAWAQAQTPNPANLLPPKFIPQSPTIRELPRFDKTELVNLPTGAAQFSIPLTDLVAGSLQVPVSLAYSFTGLQVYQPRELVGLGWSLQADASISLRVNGLLDWAAVGPYSRYNPDTISASTPAYLGRAGKNQADTGPDVYSFSLPGGPSGCFILRDTTVVLLPQQPVQVRLLRSLAQGFQITTEDGQRYQFQATERTHSGGEFGLGTYPSAWHLTRIISASNADTIRFHYTLRQSEPTPRRIAVTTGGYSLVFTGAGAAGDGACASAMTYHWNNAVVAGARLSPQYLDSITARGTHVVFTRDAASLAIREVRVLSTIGTQRETKRFTLFQSYFDMQGNSTDQHLRLDSVQESGPTVKLPPYRLRYNTAVHLPPRSSAAVDFWGYYNGQLRNGGADNPGGPALLADPRLGDLMPIRTPDFLFAVAGALLQVTYPTGGTSRWEYESSRLSTRSVPLPTDPGSVFLTLHAAYSATNHSLSLTGRKQVTYSDTLNFRLSEAGTVVLDITRILQNNDSLYAFKSKYQDFNLWQHLPNGDSTLMTTSATPVQSYSVAHQQRKRRFSFPLVAGRYTLQLYCENNEDLSALLGVPFTAPPSTAALEGSPGAGVRVRRTRTATPGAPALCRTYEYMFPGSVRPYSSGMQLAGGPGIASKETWNIYDYCASCHQLQTSSDNSRIGEELYRYSFFYGCVTVWDSLSQGATTSYFTNLDSQFNDVVLTDRQVFRQGSPGARGLRLVQDDEYRYGVDSTSIYPCIRVYQKVFNDGSCPPTGSFYAVEQIGALVVGPTLLRFTQQTRYDEQGNPHVTLTRSNYQQQRLVRTATRTSTGWDIQRYKRLSDYAPLPAVRALRVNAFNPVIEAQTWHRALSERDSVLVAGSITLYEPAWRSPARTYRLRLDRPAPGPNQETRLNGRFASWLSDTRYEPTATARYAPTSGDLLEQRPTHGPPTSYLMGYDRTLVIAEAKNAAFAQIAYTSFEPEATGRWRYDSTGTHRVPGGRTGGWAYRLDATGSVRRPGLPAGDYELRFWVQGRGTPQVTVGSGSRLEEPQVVAAAPGGWQQYRCRLRLTGVGSVAVGAPVGGSSPLVDEVRLGPVGARLTTYTHAPLVGLTSQTDPSGRTVTYEYDGLGRLLRARDEQGRILAEQQYHYARP